MSATSQKSWEACKSDGALLLRLAFQIIDEEEDWMYMGAVFCFADNVRGEGNATYSVSQISENWFTPNNIQNLPNFTPQKNTP